MCIIVYTPNGHLPKKQMANCLRKNSDGWGLMYAENGKLVIHKGMYFADFFDLHKTLRDKTCPMVFHARIATHGKVDLDHCHPFMIPSHGELAMCHNGIIGKQSDTGAGSDTMNFIENVVSKLPWGFLDNKGITEMMSDYIGYSKLAFMSGDGEVVIINSGKGIWDQGRWYSNDSYKNTYMTFFKGKSKVTGNFGGMLWDKKEQSWIDPDTLTDEEWKSFKEAQTCPDFVYDHLPAKYTEIKEVKKESKLTGFMSAKEYKEELKKAKESIKLSNNVLPICSAGELPVASEMSALEAKNKVRALVPITSCNNTVC